MFFYGLVRANYPLAWMYFASLRWVYKYFVYSILSIIIATAIVVPNNDDDTDSQGIYIIKGIFICSSLLSAAMCTIVFANYHYRTINTIKITIGALILKGIWSFIITIAIIAILSSTEALNSEAPFLVIACLGFTMSTSFTMYFFYRMLKKQLAGEDPYDEDTLQTGLIRGPIPVAEATAAPQPTPTSAA